MSNSKVYKHDACSRQGFVLFCRIFCLSRTIICIMFNHGVALSSMLPGGVQLLR